MKETLFEIVAQTIESKVQVSLPLNSLNWNERKFVDT